MTARVVVPDVDQALTPLSSPPTFSIVVCVYEAAHLVGEAIESLLVQTMPPHELIVCDDGSTDGLADALAPYAAHLTLLRQEHKGVAAARNLGLYHATGEFVVGCDADDKQMPRMVEALGELAMARPDLDILCRASFRERDRKVIGLSRTPEAPKFPVDDQRMGILRGNFLSASSAVRRVRLLDVEGYDEKLLCAEDYDAWLRLIFKGSRAGLVLEPLGVYRHRKGSLSSNEVSHLRGVMAALMKLCEQHDLSEAERTVAEKRISVNRRGLRLAEARAEARLALAEGRPDARRKCLRVVVDRGHRPVSRLKAAIGATAPRWVGRRI